LEAREALGSKRSTWKQEKHLEAREALGSKRSTWKQEKHLEAREALGTVLEACLGFAVNSVLTKT
jgi:hypothetical protein